MIAQDKLAGRAAPYRAVFLRDGGPRAANQGPDRRAPKRGDRSQDAGVRVSRDRSGTDKGRLGVRRPLITVFGSSRAKPDDALYQEGYTLGRLLGEAGFDVATGGYRGVMEAVSRGARTGGAHVLGVTVASFKDEANPFTAQEIRSKDIYTRLRQLIESGDAYVALRGGMGTLCEVVFAWQMLKLALLPARPLVLVGQCWGAVLERWLEQLTVTESDCDCFTLTKTPEEAAAFLGVLFFADKKAPAQPK
jgi:uncharacterized protein (TIGR00730 family)